MKKIILIISLITVLTILASCAFSQDQEAADTNDTSESNVGDQEINEVVEETEGSVKFYYDGGIMNGHLNRLKGEEFGTADSYMFVGCAKETVIETMVGSKRNVLDRGEYTYQYSRVTYVDDKSDEPAKGFGVHHYYKSEDGSEKVAFYEDTDLITYYSVKADENYAGDKIDEAKALHIAADFVSEFLKNYPVTEMQVSVSYELKSYWVRYYKEVDGVHTFENFKICIDENGWLVGYNGINLGKFKDCDKIATDDQIKSACEALIEAFEKADYNYKSVEILEANLDVYGNKYVRVKVVTDTVETEDYEDYIYVKL